MDLGFLIMIVSFIVYYILVLFFEKKMIRDPKDIIEKFLSIILLYAGISLIYFSITALRCLIEMFSTIYIARWSCNVSCSFMLSKTLQNC